VQFLSDKQRASGSFAPVDERALSEFVRAHLQSGLVERGIVLNREAQLRPSVAPGAGERTDIHVDAVAQDAVREVFDTLTIVVETKGGWDPELFTAIKTQQRQRYLSGTRVTQGDLPRRLVCVRALATSKRQSAPVAKGRKRTE
jgi:hypothetical protein